MDKNLLIWYTISPEQMCQLMDSYIILRAFNLHHLKVFASKRFLLWFHTANQWLPGVEVLFAEDNTIDIIHEHTHTQSSSTKHNQDYVTSYQFKFKKKPLQIR